MSWMTYFLAAFCIAALAVHLASIALVGRRLRRAAPESPSGARPPITLVRPVCGLENHVEETLRSSFRLDYPDYEVIFCAARADDPVVPLVERLIAEHPQVPARLLTGDDAISGNPKLNNVVKGWNAARAEWIVMADSNLLLPADYLDRLLAVWTPGTGLVSSPAYGSAPEGFAAALEAGFLNSYQARWQLAADELGNGYAQGKTLFWRRDVLESGGGLKRLGAEMAEDVASTKLVRGAGLKVRVAQRPFAQPIGRKRLAEVWSRQLRWAKVRRLGFPLLFAPEVLTGALPPALALTALVALGAVPSGALPLGLVLWYGAEWLFTRSAGWPAGPRDIAAWLLRDLMVPALWVGAWAGRDFTWRGNHMAKADATGLTPAASE
ncbi:ceramide glucosyltransferase [Acidimangrovimonas pyrenivorans]|uniref:Ceramide glucosyltransferase n=1 Tax=Acidimangrovimonas pyrenivorans TaxID=2030798 RepID=A0ABV7AES8_9RHOB